MQTVVLIEDILQPDTWERLEVEDVRALLVERFATWPATARIYHQEMSNDHLVPLSTPEDVERLGSLEGLLYVCVYPGDPVTIVVATIAAVAVAAAVFLMGRVPAVAQRNSQTESPNNSLADRTNKPRPNGRVPDIYGSVLSVPDLLAVPYKVFRDHREVEVAYMCVGRGAYEVGTIYDDATPVDEIEGMQVEVYGPGTSPLSGAPQLTIGGAITDELLSVSRSTAVNGQTLHPPNYKRLVATDNVRAESSNSLKIRDTSVFVWPELFEVGDEIVITNGTVDGKNLSGTYTVSGVNNDFLTLDNPAAVNAAWGTIGGPTSWYGPTIQVVGTLEVGPIYADIPAGGKLIMNTVALGGLYKMNSSQQFKEDVTVQFTLTPVDEDGVPTGGASQDFSGTVLGSATTKSTRAVTIICDPAASGRFAVTGSRITDTDYAIDGTVVDEIKWRDMYIAQAIDATDFGDVTTVMAVTPGTEGALALKDRKLNLEVTRKLPQRVAGSTFTSELFPTDRADDIISALCLDPKIGARPASQVDFDSIYDTISEAEAYFGTAEAVQFGYTFDKDNLSFEETLAVVADAVFCRAYRRGSVIKLFLERATDDSVLLFNHRNKLPGSETRTVSFGQVQDYDGVAYEYTSPDDGSVITLYVPQGDASAARPRKEEGLGVRNEAQAHIHAWRAWNRLLYQHTSTEFEATREAELVIPGERVLSADNTRSGTRDGYIIDQDALLLTLSQPSGITGDATLWSIFLQLSDGTTQSIALAAVDPLDDHLVTLSEAPSVALVTDPLASSVTTYLLAGPSDVGTRAFLVLEKEPQDTLTSVVRAINYDARYYTNDLDFATP